MVLKIFYRSFNPADISWMKRLYEENVSALSPGADPQSSLDWIISKRDDVDFTVAETEEGTPIGYIGFVPNRFKHGYLKSLDDENHKSMVLELYIFRRFHGTGMADAIHQDGIHRMIKRGIQYIYASTYIDNVAANKFFERRYTLLKTDKRSRTNIYYSRL